MSSNIKKLYRSESDRMIGGVCAGLGEYFDIDPTIVRLIWAIAVLMGGSGVLLYLILWIVVPTESSVKKVRDDVIEENVQEIKESAEKVAKKVKKTVSE